ncbi:hypothetical protein BDE02_10G019300 [Populus trichocarpa]|nr:hypothetical protein BDE02_10G019300 [Populus trichocarpa]
MERGSGFEKLEDERRVRIESLQKKALDTCSALLSFCFPLAYHDIAISRRIFFICIMFCVFQFPTKPLLSLICVFLQARFACISLCFASSSWCRYAFLPVLGFTPIQVHV